MQPRAFLAQGVLFAIALAMVVARAGATTRAAKTCSDGALGACRRLDAPAGFPRAGDESLRGCPPAGN